MSLSVVNNSAAKISGTPGINDIGDHLVNVLVEDGNGGSDTQAYTLTVNDSEVPNNPPLISSDPITSAIVNQLYKYDVIADDPDNDQLSFSIIQAPSCLILSVAPELSQTFRRLRCRYGKRHALVGLHTTCDKAKEIIMPF